jgi:hypothetical protein
MQKEIAEDLASVLAISTLFPVDSMSKRRRKRWELAALLITVLSIAAISVYGLVYFRWNIPTNVTISSSYDLYVTFPNGTKATSLDLGTLTPTGQDPPTAQTYSSFLTIAYVGNNASGVNVTWNQTGLPTYGIFTAQENSTGTLLNWIEDVGTVHLNIGQNFTAQWFFSEVNWVAGPYSWTLTIMSSA